MLVPLRSEVISQHYFLNVTEQQEKQPVAEFVAALQKGIAECNLMVKKECECGKENNILVADFFLRTQFIRGICDAWPCEQSLQSTETDFDSYSLKQLLLKLHDLNYWIGKEWQQRHFVGRYFA